MLASPVTSTGLPVGPLEGVRTRPLYHRTGSVLGVLSRRGVEDRSCDYGCQYRCLNRRITAKTLGGSASVTGRLPGRVDRVQEQTPRLVPVRLSFELPRFSHNLSCHGYRLPICVSVRTRRLQSRVASRVPSSLLGTPVDQFSTGLLPCH